MNTLKFYTLKSILSMMLILLFISCTFELVIAKDTTGTKQSGAKQSTQKDNYIWEDGYLEKIFTSDH